MKFDVKWIDRRRVARYPPNPEFPYGAHLDASQDAKVHCTVPLPYPAARCGVYLVKCLTCQTAVGVTTAGRADDPVSVRLACQRVIQ